MTRELLYVLAWEWMNIALEYAATGWWVKLPRWMPAVCTVNLITHPLLMLAICRWGMSFALVLPCEVAVVLVEWAVLTGIYGKSNWRKTLTASAVMNSASYLTGLAL